MRHGKKFNHLSRPTAHRKALLTNLAKSLLLHKRIHTTVEKAKALRKFVEPILTKAKVDTTHARRVVFSHFQDKLPVKELFNNIVPKIIDRPGGYTRIIRLGNRLGDNAEMCMIELVDYNDLLQKSAKPQKIKTRRSRGRSKVETSADVGSQLSTNGKSAVQHRTDADTTASKVDATTDTAADLATSPTTTQKQEEASSTVPGTAEPTA